ncbi:hypothetical protein GCM10028805_48060 [Spirosoma harenae]
MLDTDQPGPPPISILIAARNEESTILDCLRAIDRLDYPSDRFEVIVGNDQSTDQTAELVNQFIASRPNFQLVAITENVAGLRGKANVLAQLTGLAKGQYLFFTDADTQVPPSWLVEMGGAFKKDTGIITGITLPEGPSLFHKIQTIDWLYNLTLTYLVGSLGIPVTAMGNNMAVSRRAYEAVGGYESLPFSVTEDYTLFWAIVQKGYGFRTLFTERILAQTKPINTFIAFLQQRKRWMRGAVQLPLGVVTLLYLNYLAGPLLLLLGWFMPAVAIGLYLSRLLIQTTVLSMGISWLRRNRLWPYALLFELYQLIIGPVAILNYWLPTAIDWKGRKYE